MIFILYISIFVYDVLLMSRNHFDIIYFIRARFLVRLENKRILSIFDLFVDRLEKKRKERKCIL